MISFPPFPRWWDLHAKTLQKHWSTWVEQNRIPQVILLAGAWGIGKEEVAAGLSARILCEKSPFQSPEKSGELSLFGEPANSNSCAPTDGAPCGNCQVCQQLASRQWIDFSVLDVPDDGTLKIDLFRELKEKQGHSAYQGNHQIFYIPKVERLTIQAANSVLKIFEEPPKGWIFILTTEDPSLLPTTVLSRSYVIRLGSLNNETLSRFLIEDGLDPSFAQTVIPFAHGSYRRALALQEKPASEWITKVPQPAELIDQVMQNPQLFSIALDCLETHFKRKIESPAVSSAEKFALFAHLDRFFETRTQMHLPVNQKLLIQNAFMPLL